MILTIKKLYFSIQNKIHTIIIRVRVSSKNVKYSLSCNIKLDTVFEGANRIGERTSFSGKIGYGSYLGNDCKISAEIGRFCSIASKVETLSGTHPTKKYISTSPAFYSLQKTSGVSFVSKQKFVEYKKAVNDYDVVIGNDVWIGSGVSILGGVKIGDGAIIAANATVTRNVEPYSVVAGVPSKEIRKRFDEKQIKFLQEYKWWNKSEQWLIDNAELFDDINNFLYKTKGGNNMLKLNVIGLGYIGLPTALMFASHGVVVVGTDYNNELVKTLQEGNTTFEEDGLDELFKEAVVKGIKFSTEYISAEVYIIAVPTPFDKFTKKIDPCYVIAAVEKVINICPKGAIIVIESTVSPGTIEKFVRSIIESKGFTIGEDIHLVHAPERIIPSNMVHELKYNSRTIGADDIKIGEKIKKLYSSFCNAEIVVTDISTAEMTKVVENTFRDINIAFANELTKICRFDNINVYEIIKIANMHPRVNILQPGPGVGGHCISVDPWFLVGDYPGLANIILAARKINDSMPEYVLERVHNIMKENGLSDITRVGLYGLTYKENVDDVRESPSLQLLEIMEKHLAPVLKTYDPYVKKNILKNQYHNFDEFLNSIEVVIIMVAHDQIKEEMNKLEGKIILDAKNICNIEGAYKL